MFPLLPGHMSVQIEDGAKRQRLSDCTIGAAASPAPMASGGKSGIRRSTRHRKLRGERALIVSANQTLKELKIQVRGSPVLPSMKA